MDSIVQFDQQFFFLINRVFVNDVFDVVLPLMRSKYFWAPLYLFLIVYFIRNFGTSGVWKVVFLLLTFALTDYVSAGIIKESVQRLRPCNDPEIISMVRNIVGCGSGYSFVSSHASNHFGIAIFLIYLFDNKVWINYTFKAWAIVICYAQVYVGVHYPLDVICGSILGIILANIVIYIHKFALRKQWIS